MSSRSTFQWDSSSWRRDDRVNQQAETRRRERKTSFVVSSVAIIHAVSNHRSSKINSFESLKENDFKEYSSWVYSIREKLDKNALMYANDRQRIRYAFSQMKDSIFDAMHDWIANIEDALIMKSFFKAIENYMKLHHQAKNAKKRTSYCKNEKQRGCLEILSSNLQALTED